MKVLFETPLKQLNFQRHFTDLFETVFVSFDAVVLLLTKLIK